MAHPLRIEHPGAEKSGVGLRGHVFFLAFLFLSLNYIDRSKVYPPASPDGRQPPAEGNHFWDVGAMRKPGKVDREKHLCGVYFKMTMSGMPGCHS
jgi:hypothetical protein